MCNNRLAGHGKSFLAGTERPTIADFKLFAAISIALPMNTGCQVPDDVQQILQQEIEEKPAYKAWIKKMEQELAPWLAKRPPVGM